MLKQYRQVISAFLTVLFVAGWGVYWTHIVNEEHIDDHAGHHHKAERGHSSGMLPIPDGHECHSIRDHELVYDATAVKDHKPVTIVHAVLTAGLEFISDTRGYRRQMAPVFRPPQPLSVSHAGNRAPPSILI